MTPTLAVDLDGTLVSVNTFPHFVRHLVLRLALQGRLAAAGRLAIALLGRKALRRSHLEFKRRACVEAERLAPGVMEAWAVTTLRQYESDEVRDLVRDWPGLTILCTAAPEVYARHIGAAVGFGLTLGSLETADGFLDNTGEAKVGRLKENGVSRLDAAVTDDDVVDAPMLAIAERRLLVKDGRILPGPGPAQAAELARQD